MVRRAAVRPDGERRVSALAIDLDGVLGDTKPLWEAFLTDVSRRAQVDPARLEDELPNWRALLERFAEDHAPVYLRPSAPATAALRRLQEEGVRVGVFTDAPEELARVALAHLGGARRIEALEAGPGALERLLALMPDARVVRTLAEL
jgi:phosphoglycolate phosphatase-like HAD superfamily hydrolase